MIRPVMVCLCHCVCAVSNDASADVSMSSATMSPRNNDLYVYFQLKHETFSKQTTSNCCVFSLL